MAHLGYSSVCYSGVYICHYCTVTIDQIYIYIYFKKGYSNVLECHYRPIFLFLKNAIAAFQSATIGHTYSCVCETPLQTYPIVAFCKPHYCQKPPTKKKFFDDQNLIFGNQNFLFLKFESININCSKFLKKDEHEELRNFF